MLWIKEKRGRHICGLCLVTLVLLVIAIAVVKDCDVKKELVSDIKEATRFDVYLYAKGKDRLVGKSDTYEGGVGLAFGETTTSVFGEKIELNENEIEQFTYDAWMLLKFHFPKRISRLNVYCHEISDPSLLSDDVRTACFVDKETGLLHLVQVGDEFYEVVNKDFFSDIMLLLREKYGIGP